LKRTKHSNITLIVIILGLIFILILPAIIDPWIAGKIRTKLNQNEKYLISIEKIHIHLLSSAIQLDSISILSKRENDKSLKVKGQIESIKIKGINILRLVLRKKITIKSISFYNSCLTGILPFNKEGIHSVIIPLDIKADRLMFDKTNLSVSALSNSVAYSIKDGEIKVYNLHLIKNDTLSTSVINRIDFKAMELASVTADSMYSFSLYNFDYNSNSNMLSADSFFIHPNYNDYNFTSRYKYQKDRIGAVISDIKIKDLDAGDYIRSGRLSSTYAEVGNLDLIVFRDKRKEFNHTKRPVFQELIYSYDGIISIDTIAIISGNIIYKEHAEKANDPGQIVFNNISAEIYNISNDTLFKTKEAYLELKCNALLMGKSKLKIQLKSKIFDVMNTFTVSGRLSEMEISDMNPFLEKSALLYATSGRIKAIDFNFTANDSLSKGSLTMLYNGLKIAVKNKKTDDTIAIRERIISYVVNRKVLDANPSKDEEVRIGIINYQRDPEKFLFSYFARSFLSGMKSSILKDSGSN